MFPILYKNPPPPLVSSQSSIITKNLKHHIFSNFHKRHKLFIPPHKKKTPQQRFSFITMSGGYSARGPVKVVIINTQYVETDSISFKSVVQRLTGKDSKIEIDPSSNYSSASGFRGNDGNNKVHQQQQQQMTRYGPATGLQMSSHVPIMSRGLSFKDFDWLLKELPPLDELFRLCPE